ncbi:MAG TPA: sialidase, partial [Candidatus Eisenbacteria bacterium]
HLFGPIKLEIFDAHGKLVDTISATKRRGINRVSWSMRVKPPRVPRAAQIASSASQGPRVPPGVYTARLTRGGQAIETKLEVAVDRRAPYGAAERREQFEAAMAAHALFGDMSALMDRIESARSAALQRAGALPEADALRKRLQAAADRLEEVRKKIVATKEGGAITGEERLREHLDTVYGAILGWEGRPARYQVERVRVLKRELADVQSEFERLVSSELAPLNQELRQRSLEPIPGGTKGGGSE